MFIIDDDKKIKESGYTEKQFKAVMDYVLGQIEPEKEAATCTINITNYGHYTGSISYISANGERIVRVDAYSDVSLCNVACGCEMKMTMENSDARVEFDSLITQNGETPEGLGVIYDLIAPSFADSIACITIM